MNRSVITLVVLMVAAAGWYFIAADPASDPQSSPSGPASNQQASTPVSPFMGGEPVAAGALAASSASSATPAPVVEKKQQPSPFKQALEDWRQRLVTSGSVEDLMVAATLAAGVESREQLLFEALQLDPDNPLLNYMVIEHCLNAPASSQCGPEIFDALEIMDRNNGAVRDFKAIQAYRDGDVDGALQALYEATSTGVTDDYQWQTMAAVGDSLSRRGIPRNGDYMLEVISVAASSSGKRLAELSRICSEQQTNDQWRAACLGRGTVMSRNGLSLGSELFGYGLAMASATDTQAFLDEHQEWMNGQRAQFRDLSTRFKETVLANDNWQLSDQQWQTYLEIFASDGELAAFKYLVEDAR